MPNIQKILNEEIRRLARREIRNELADLKKQLASMRKSITEQSCRIKALEGVVPAPAKSVATRKSSDCRKAGTCYGGSDQKAANETLPFPKEFRCFAGRYP